MELPFRHNNHIIETQSFKIFERWIPDRWVVRQLTERDYGIDAYIEIVNSKNQLTGNLVSVQLKGSSKFISLKNENGRNIGKFSGIKVETANYWFETITPVFLLVVDVKKEDVYFVPVKKQIRNKYQDFKTQKIISFILEEKNSSLSESGIQNFLIEYFLEKESSKIFNHIRNLFAHWRHYIEYMHEEIGRDGFLPLDEPEMFIHLYKVIRELASLLMIDWKAAELSEIYEYDKGIGDPSDGLHSFTMDKYLPGIEKMFFVVFEKAREVVIDLESYYWMSHEFAMWKKAHELYEVTYENRNRL